MNEMDLLPTADGVLLPILARPKAGRNAFTGIHNGRLKVALTQPPERGKANAALLKLLAVQLGVKKSQLQLTAGESSPQKTIRITGMTPEALRQRIREILGTR